MNRIHALETWWHGFRFRSRTEARWAVFFSHLGIHFQYEPEGYKLPDGKWYLPDFWLPQIRAWAEVKGSAPTTDEMIRCEQLASGTGRLVLILDGPPDFRAFVGVSNLDGIGAIWQQYSLDIDAHQRVYFHDEHRLFSDPEIMTETMVTAPYRDAVFASRSERFDDRQNPRPGHEPFNLSDRELGGVK